MGKVKSVLVVGGGPEYARMFTSLNFKLAESVGEANLVCFTGGADVYPLLYGEPTHPKTSYDHNRDNVDTITYDEAIKLSKPMVGICRGAQFLHVMQGGTLFQHVNKHATGAPHIATDLITGEQFDVTSTHHQMMHCNGKAGELIASADIATLKEWVSNNKIYNDTEAADAEVVWHKKNNVLCFQPHPEFNNTIKGANSTYSYFKNLLDRYLKEI